MHVFPFRIISVSVKVSDSAINLMSIPVLKIFNFLHVTNEAGLVTILNKRYTVFHNRYKEDLNEEHRHKIVWLSPYHCHFSATELVWLQAKTRYYNTNIGQNGLERKLGRDDVGEIIGGGLLFWHNDIHSRMKSLPLLILWNSVIDTMVQMYFLYFQITPAN